MKMLTVKQAAEILGVHHSRVRVLIRGGRLPAQKVGRDWIILEPDLEFVKERKPGRPAKTKIVNVNVIESDDNPEPKKVRISVSKLGDEKSGHRKPNNKGGGN